MQKYDLDSLSVYGIGSRRYLINGYYREIVFFFQFFFCSALLFSLDRPEPVEEEENGEKIHREVKYE